MDGPVHQDVDPAPVMVGQTDRRMHVVQSNRALSAVEEVFNSRLNMQVSNVLDTSFWETEDADKGE